MNNAPSKSVFSGTLLEDGRVLLALLNKEQYIQIYDPKTDKFTLEEKIYYIGKMPKATLLQDGSVLLTGSTAKKAALYIPKRDNSKN